eukprot:TRINITY_DN945_c0_g2_i2.p1 TRINITY_DN945_c0_g2~~TRINITY_DN945_c0_g2_i2.p1  ORF type:complete len:601 (-),score=121.51 TRINITY_DN945_c0_g2_i2:178-1980(-)
MLFVRSAVRGCSSQVAQKKRAKLALAGGTFVALLSYLTGCLSACFVITPLAAPRLPEKTEALENQPHNKLRGAAAGLQRAAGTAAAAAALAVSAAASVARSFAVVLPSRRRRAAATAALDSKQQRPQVAFGACSGLGYSSATGVSSTSSSFLGASMPVSVAFAAEPAGPGPSSMKMIYERLNSSSLKAVMMAREESRRLGHNFIGTEMLLVGVVAHAAGLSAKVFKTLGVTSEDTMKTVEKMIGRGTGPVPDHIGFTPAANRVFEAACKLTSNDIDTDHILLSLLKEDNRNTTQLLAKLGVDPAKVPSELIKERAKKDEKSLVGVSSRGDAPSGTLAEEWRDFYQEDEQACEAGWGIDVLGDDTLIKRILRVSPRNTRGCKPHLADNVTIHYVSRLENGSVIEDTRKRGEPFQFRVGHEQAIRGVEEAVMSMSSGETSLFYIDPKLAYGTDGIDRIVPPDATLLYEIELVQFVDMHSVAKQSNEDVEIPLDLDKMGKNDLGQGGDDPQGRWRWERHGQVMVVVVPIDEETSGKDIECLLLKNHISASLRGEILFDGEPGLEIDENESDWEIKEDISGQRCAFIHLVKNHEFERWPPTLLK